VISSTAGSEVGEGDYLEVGVGVAAAEAAAAGVI
jgi:hypothetical protein